MSVTKSRGEVKSTVDAKGRMNIPSKFRDKFGDKVILARMLDAKCIMIMASDEEWEEFTERYAGGLTEIEINRLERFWAATDVEVDGQGRILIPASFRKYAGLDGEVMVKVVKNWHEIWDKETHEITNTGDNMEELVQMINRPHERRI